VRDQNNFDVALRDKRLLTLALVFLLHRYKVDAVHFVTPTDDNRRQAEKMTRRGIFSSAEMEIGAIIVAVVNKERIAELVASEHAAMDALITGA
jgi:isocitrate lyase